MCNRNKKTVLLSVCIILCVIIAGFTTPAFAALNSWESERYTTWSNFKNSKRYALVDKSNSYLLSRLNVGLGVYKVGSTFFKGSSGPKVTPDKSGNVSLGASQCMGYAHWWFYVFYGQTPSGIGYSCLKSSTTYTVDAIKKLITNTGAGLGTHIRFNGSTSASGHSVVLLGYDSTGLVYLEGNYNSNYGICVSYSTWSTFINGMKSHCGAVKYYVETPMIKKGDSSPKYATQYASTTITGTKIQNKTIQLNADEATDISYSSEISTKKDSNSLSLREGLYDGSWKSSDERVCIVENICDSKGNVTGGRIVGVNAGTATITVRTKLNLTASLTVKIISPDFIFPANTQIIDEQAFYGISAYSVKLPNTIISIGSKAFSNCPNLAFIYIPETCTDIAIDAFDSTSDLTIYGKVGSYAEQFASKRGFKFIAANID